MKYTKEHNLAKPESNDDVIDSIDKYAWNFDKIDSLLPKSIPNLNLYLTVGEKYERGRVLYNSLPVIGGYTGWINIREGVHVKEWKKDTKYNVGDLVTSDTNNGHYYKCITDGTSSSKPPTFPTISGDTVDDTYGILSWTPSKPYTVGEICKKTTSGTTYYYKCMVAGTTNTIEPTWNDTEGVIIVDGSVSWLVCKKAVWQEQGASSEFRPYGKIE